MTPNCNICMHRILTEVFNIELSQYCERCPVERENAVKLTAAEREPDAIFVLPSREFIEPELQAEINALIRQG